MTTLLTAHANTGLSPEWDRWFDEAFTDLITSDDELLRAEFDALVNAASPPPPPPPPPPPSPPAAVPGDPGSDPGRDPFGSARHRLAEWPGFH